MLRPSHGNANANDPAGQLDPDAIPTALENGATGGCTKVGGCRDPSTARPDDPRDILARRTQAFSNLRSYRLSMEVLPYAQWLRDRRIVGEGITAELVGLNYLHFGEG